METTKIVDIEGIEVKFKDDIMVKDESLLEVIFEFQDVDLCIYALNRYFELNGEETVEIISRLSSMYQFSGSKIIEKVLIEVCLTSKLSSFLKYESSKSLIMFEEMKENIDVKDSDKMKEIKKLSNENIDKRNVSRREKGYFCLDNVCKTMVSLATPCRVEGVFLLMECKKYRFESLEYLKRICNDQNIDCDYRYKIILSLEKTNKIGKEDKEFYLRETCLSFLFTKENMTMYKILSGQYLLQNLKLDESEENNVNRELLSFSEDEDLDYNLRADSADTLLNCSKNDEIKNRAKEIIMILGHIYGRARNIFENAQNVHTEEIEKSVYDVLEFLSKFPTQEIDNRIIDFEYINTYIEKYCKDLQESKKNNKVLCTSSISSRESTGSTGSTESTETIAYTVCNHCKCKYCESCIYNDNKFCRDSNCVLLYDKEEKIKISLNRINVDRVLYSKFNQSLVNILLKIWSYIQTHEFKEAMYNRLLEELYDMAGTCSSGFASRLINTISGFGDFNIRISWDDQITANFSGRLNAKIHQITNKDSVYYLKKHREVVELYMRHINIIQKRCDAKDLSDKSTLKTVIDNYLSTDKYEKINLAVEYFYESVISEMIIPSSNYHDRQNFIKFFRDNMLSIRQDLYEEFKGYITDTEFDLCIRKAISQYEGLDLII